MVPGTRNHTVRLWEVKCLFLILDKYLVKVLTILERKVYVSECVSVCV